MAMHCRARRDVWHIALPWGFCYAELMMTPRGSTRRESLSPLRKGAGDRGGLLGLGTWLFPKPFDNVSSLLYLGTFLLFLYDGYRHNYGRSLEWGSTVVVAVALFALLLADRWDFWFYEGAAPNRIAALLLATRMVLIEVVAQLDAFSFSAFLYLVVPFMGFLYLGMRLCYLLAGF